MTVPPNGNPVSIWTSPLAFLPTNGTTFAILSSGDASSVAGSQDTGASASNGGGQVDGRGDPAQDVVVLKTDFDVPATANCVSIDFRFASEEFPEYIGGEFNDAFIAELDTSDWTTLGSEISAPHNFAFDPSHAVISVNASGVTSMTAGEGAGTIFDGATPLLRASTPVSPGPHSLYLSVFDQGDDILDSAAFVDNLRLTSESSASCVPGAVLKRNPPPPDNSAPNTLAGTGPSGMIDSKNPTFTFGSSEPGTTFQCSLDGATFAVCRSPYSLSGLAPGRHVLRVRAVDAAGNVDPTPTEFVFTVARQLEDLPAPKIGKQINVDVVKGTVLIAVPAGAGAAGRGAHASQKGLTFVPLQEARQIPTGSYLDTKRGTVELVSATGATTKTQAGQFTAGLFQVLQSRKKRDKGLTNLRLKGGSFNNCRVKRGKRGRRASAAKLRKRTIRKVRSNAHGRFRTTGRHSDATVRGTAWITADRCDGTLTTVTRGTVAVRDFRRKRKTILVKAGKSYLAKAPR
jgi:hypothetical protein